MAKRKRSADGCEQLSLDDLSVSRPPACSAPTKDNPGGRTGTIMGREAHNRAGEQPCAECRDAAAAYQRARYVKKDPAVVAAERAARTVARLAEYEGRPVCAVPSSKFPDGRTGTNAGYYTHTGIGETPCDECRAANREYSKARISLRKEAGGGHGAACQVPTRDFPEGRTGTSPGYFAHYYTGEPPCDACLEGHATAMREKRRADPLGHKHLNLKSRFKLTIDDYDRMLTEQNGGCAICGSRTPGHGGSSYGGFHVDHDHSCCPGGGKKTCGKCVRGLLCGPCNTGMGNLGDDPERLIAAANYLLAARKRRSDGTTPAQAGDAA